MPKPTATVLLYPTTGPEAGTVPGVPAVAQAVTPEEAERLLAFVPPAFSTSPPDAADDPQPTTEPKEA